MRRVHVVVEKDAFDDEIRRVVGVFTSAVAANTAAETEEADYAVWSGGDTHREWEVLDMELNSHGRHWDVHRSLGGPAEPVEPFA